jgi:hypothetical protein
MCTPALAAPPRRLGASFADLPQKLQARVALSIFLALVGMSASCHSVFVKESLTCDACQGIPDKFPAPLAPMEKPV